MTVAVTCTARATVTGTEQRPALPHFNILFSLNLIHILFKHSNPSSNVKQNREHYIYKKPQTDSTSGVIVSILLFFFNSAVFHTYRSRNGMTFCRFYWPLSVETPRAGRTCVDYHWWVQTATQFICVQTLMFSSSSASCPNPASH